MKNKVLRLKIGAAVAGLMWMSSCLQAEVILPKILGHNMVLQCDKKVPIWGWAAPGEHITVKFKGQTKETVADISKKWQVMLDAMPASDQPAEMQVIGSNTVTLDNILIGEVWLCSGQSNMEYTMRKNSKAEQNLVVGKPTEDELEVAKNPNIRIFLVNRKFMSPEPNHKGWNVARDSALRTFSAVGYFFAKNLYNQLHVPIGMISSAVPGSAIEPWISAGAFASSSYFASTDSLKHSKEVGKFYPTMVEPLIPFAMRGMLWYQGETNCFQNETLQYAYKMRLLIESWRSAFKDNELPFYFVEIAPFYYSKSKGKYPLTDQTLPNFREAQSLALQLPHTAWVMTSDLVDSLDNLHPGHKREIGRRLSLVALSQTYGKNMEYSGPVFSQMKLKGNKIEIEFDHCTDGLVSCNGQPLDWFAIAGADGKFIPADAVILDNKVIVSAASVPKPTQVQFGWNEAAKPNLTNKDGLPAVPFRTQNPLLKAYLSKK
jgi:sialate O-acetylesterase